MFSLSPLSLEVFFPSETAVSLAPAEACQPLQKKTLSSGSSCTPQGQLMERGRRKEARLSEGLSWIYPTSWGRTGNAADSSGTAASLDVEARVQKHGFTHGSGCVWDRVLVGCLMIAKWWFCDGLEPAEGLFWRAAGSSAPLLEFLCKRRHVLLNFSMKVLQFLLSHFRCEAQRFAGAVCFLIVVEYTSVTVYIQFLSICVSPTFLSGLWHSLRDLRSPLDTHQGRKSSPRANAMQICCLFVEIQGKSEFMWDTHWVRIHFRLERLPPSQM